MTQNHEQDSGEDPITLVRKSVGVQLIGSCLQHLLAKVEELLGRGSLVPFCTGCRVTSIDLPVCCVVASQC